jgi:hypothetical protein
MQTQSATWHRRHAIQIAAQLLDDPGDALLVLEYARQLVEIFLADRPRAPSPDGSVCHSQHRPEVQNEQDRLDPRGRDLRHLCCGSQLPLPKSGGCPPGFRESGGFCVAGEDTRTLAIPKTGPCPAGWITSGNYCTRPAERR